MGYFLFLCFFFGNHVDNNFCWNILTTVPQFPGCLSAAAKGRSTPQWLLGKTHPNFTSREVFVPNGMSITAAIECCFDIALLPNLLRLPDFDVSEGQFFLGRKGGQRPVAHLNTPLRTDKHFSFPHHDITRRQTRCHVTSFNRLQTFSKN